MTDTPDLDADLDPALGSFANDLVANTRQAIDAAVSHGGLSLESLFSIVEHEGSEHKPIGHMHLRRVLLDLPHIGEVTADEILTELGLEPDRHLASLGSQQIEALITLVG